MLKGFKEFIMRGNVVELAVAVVIGGAFTAIVGAVVDGFINPLIAAIFGKPDLSDAMAFTINGAQFSIGLILQGILNFLMVAVAVYFFIVMPMNKLKERADRKKGVEPVAEAGPTQEQLLAEIRDLLQAQNAGGKQL
jgi:large conductance mechanosensitive channel